MAPNGSSSTKMAQFSSYGDVGVLELVEQLKPKAGPGQVVVEVMAAGVNHIEAYIRQGVLRDELPISLPALQGSDFAGIVVEAGSGVTGFKRGSEVVGHAVRGSHANFVVVPQENLVLKPKTLSWEIAGGLFLAGVTALTALDSINAVQGDTIVISAAAGGVGSMEAQLAKLRGVTVIGTCGERNFDYLRQIGIQPVVYGDGMVERIQKLAPNGVTAYIDNFGDYNADLAAKLGVTASKFSSSASRKMTELNAFRDSTAADGRLTQMLATLVALAAERKLDVLVSGFYPFDKIRDAFDDLEKLHARGKIVLGMRPVDNSFHGMGTVKAREVHEAGA